MPDFVLTPRLVKATFPIGDLALCRVLLLNDSRYPWVLMVPRREGIEEIADLTPADRAVFIEELAAVSDAMRKRFQPYRLNIADIGNKAPQLHIHVVARNTDDEAWPAVVWSRPLVPFENAIEAQTMRGQMIEAIAECASLDVLTEHTDPAVDHL